MMQGNVPLTGQSFASQLKTLTRTPGKSMLEPRKVPGAICRSFCPCFVQSQSCCCYQRPAYNPEADLTMALDMANTSAVVAFRRGMWGENDDAANIESHTQLLSDIAGQREKRTRKIFDKI